MAVAFDAAASTIGTSVSSLTFAHTCTGSNRLLIVGVSYGDATDTVSGVTYNSVAMTSVASANQAGAQVTAHIWRLIAPDTGANNVIITFTGTVTEAVGGAMSFTGVDQTTPLGTAATNTGGAGSTTITVTVSSAADEIVVDTQVLNNAGATVDASQTARWDRDGSVLASGGGSTETGAASTVMSWDVPGGCSYATVGVGIKPAQASLSITPSAGGGTLSSLGGRMDLTMPVPSAIRIQ